MAAPSVRMTRSQPVGLITVGRGRRDRLDAAKSASGDFDATRPAAKGPRHVTPLARALSEQALSDGGCKFSCRQGGKVLGSVRASGAEANSWFHWGNPHSDGNLS